MRPMIAAAAAVLIGTAALWSQAPEGEITLQVVKYDTLAKEVLKHRGKVVMIDFWGVNCPPCIAKLPHVVELQKKHAKDGLVVLTVTLDEPSDKEEALERLKQKKVPLTNFLLDEPTAFAQKKLRVEAVPAVYLFDRQGRWTLFTSAYVDQADAKLLELLREK